MSLLATLNGRKIRTGMKIRGRGRRLLKVHLRLETQFELMFHPLRIKNEHCGPLPS